eukprot:364582-Chlamydomonas_euryale.AAC.4
MSTAEARPRKRRRCRRTLAPKGMLFIVREPFAGVQRAGHPAAVPERATERERPHAGAASRAGTAGHARASYGSEHRDGRTLSGVALPGILTS